MLRCAGVTEDYTMDLVEINWSKQIFIEDMYYIRLKQTYKLQNVQQVDKIIHFVKCLKFPASKLGGSVKRVSLKLNGFNGFSNNIQTYHGYIKR